MKTPFGQSDHALGSTRGDLGGVHRQQYTGGSAGPLVGLRVLDLSRVLAGNMLSCCLADLGADVVKVEEAGKGDDLRDVRDGGESLYWKVVSRNKRSIAINLRHSKGRDLILRIVKHFDLFVENFRPGVLESMGLGPTTLHQVNPKLVIVRVSGWGQTGPYRAKPGFGTLIEAFSGFAEKSGFADRAPLLPSMGLADMICGLTGAMAALAALRAVDGGLASGQVVDVSLLDSLVAILAPDPAPYSVTGKKPLRMGNRGSVAAPRNLYATADGKFMAMSAATQSMTERVFRSIERVDLLEDPRFATPDARKEHAVALDEIIEEFTRRRSLADLLAFFETHQVTAGPVNDVEALMQDPHVIERRTIVAVPDGEVGWLPMPAIAPRFSQTPPALRSPAPDVGQHTSVILSELGIDEKEIHELERQGIIQCAS
jgi:crotonobetainyl-CoA:carnitine CoA-transferase CaiB-like acyl-CoA transferase